MERRMIAPHFVEDALECLRGRGLPVEPLLRSVGLSDVVDEPVSAQGYGALWLAIAAEIDDEFLGLAAHPMRRGGFTLLCHCVLNAGTLDRAIKRALRFLRVVLDDPSGRLVVADGLAQIVLQDAGKPRPAFAYRTFWLILHGISCWLIGRLIPLRVVDFACGAPVNRADYRLFFGAPVHFDQPNSRLAFDAAYLSLPTIRSERALRSFLRNAPANILVRYRHDAGLAARVRGHLRNQPPQSWPTFDALARDMGMPPVTLRRRLRAEGQSYLLMKDEIRRAQAEHLLRDTTQSVSSIASALGFAEPSAFHRAFRKWTAQSPADYRRTMPAEKDD